MKNTQSHPNALNLLNKNLKKILGHLSLRFEGINQNSVEADKLKELSNFIRTWKIPFDRLVVDNETEGNREEIVKLNSYLGKENQIIQHIGELKEFWNNPMLMYDETAQKELQEQIKAICIIYTKLYETLLTTTNLIELYFLDIDTKMKRQYNKQGIYFLHTKSDMISYIKANSVGEVAINHNTISPYTEENMESLLTAYYKELLNKGLYTITIGEYDVEKYNQLIESIFEHKVSETMKTKLFFHIDNEKLLSVKKQYIFETDKYYEYLAKQVHKAHKIVLSETEQIKNIEIPFILSSLETDIFFRYNNKINVPTSKLMEILTTYPNDTILHLENMLAKGSQPKIYYHILDIVCDEINKPIQITTQDIECALSYELIPYRNTSLTLLKQELTTKNYVSMKTTYATRQTFYEAILKYYEDNKQRIIQEIEQQLFNSASNRLETYATIIENTTHTPSTKFKYKKLGKELLALKEEWEQANILLNFEEQEEDTFRYIIEISFLGETILLDVSPYYIVDIVNVAVVYNRLAELQELHQQTHSFINDNSELFSKVTRRLTYILTRLV